VNVGPAPRPAEDPIARVKAVVHDHLRWEVERARKEDLAATPLYKRPLRAVGWALVLEILIRIVVYVVDKVLDDLAALPPDEQMRLLVARAKELKARRSARTF